jgi:purine-binding chemotaxis protein CheW
MEMAESDKNRSSEGGSPRGSKSRDGSQNAGHEELLQFVGFHVGSEEFVIDILQVQEIIRAQQLTRVPNSPACMEGVMNLRGKIIPVIALRKRFGLEEAPADKQNRIVVAEVQGSVFGFAVDAVSEVLRIPANAVELPPRLGPVEREYVTGVGKLGDRLLILLNTRLLLSEPEQKMTASAAAGA